MASGDGPKWPSPVTFDENRPKNGYAMLHLKMPELKVSGNFITGHKVNAEVKHNFSKEAVSIEVQIHDGPLYLYSKQMPEDIDPARSKYEMKKGKVEVILCKQKDTSWGSHASFLIKNDKKN